jgi:hypothetical protein
MFPLAGTGYFFWLEPKEAKIQGRAPSSRAAVAAIDNRIVNSAAWRLGQLNPPKEVVNGTNSRAGTIPHARLATNCSGALQLGG